MLHRHTIRWRTVGKDYSEQETDPAGLVDDVKQDLAAHLDALYRFALNLSQDVDQAQELVQDCCLRALNTESPVKDRGKIRAWLFQILMNLFRDRCRNRTRVPQQLHPEQLPFSIEPLPLDRLIGDEFQRSLVAMMQQLPEQQRNVLFLVVVEQLGHTEVAELLDLSKSAVKSNLSLARKRLRSQLNPAFSMKDKQ